MVNSIRKGWFSGRFWLAVAAMAAVLSGYAAKYYEFDGKSSTAMRGTNYASLKTFSVCAWIRNAKHPNATANIIFSQGSVGNGPGFSLFLNGDGELSFQTRKTGASSASNLRVFVPSLVADDDKWHLVGVTHDWESKVKRIWVDGKVRASASGASDVPDPSTTYDFCLGARQKDADINYPFTGDMAEASLWNTVLTADDFAHLMIARVDPSSDGLLGYWPLDEGSGTVCADMSSGENNLNFTGTPGAWASDSSVVYQRGVADVLTIATGSSGNTGILTDHEYALKTFSACVWVKNPTRRLATKDYAAIMGQASLASSSGGWGVYISKTGELVFQTRTQGASGSVNNLSTSADILQDEVWHSIVITHDWENKIKRIYIDGALKAEATASLPDPTSASRHFAIGIRHSGDTNYDYPCAGSFAHVSLWGKALTEEEVGVFGELCPVGNETGLVGYWPLDDGIEGPFADLAGSHPGRRLGSADRYSLDAVPFFERQIDLSVEASGLEAFTLRANALGRTGAHAAKVVWGPESAPRLHTNDLGTVELPLFSATVSRGLLPGAAYRAQVLVTTDVGTMRSPVVPFSAPCLPGEGYQEVSWIESTGAQMIDTEYLPNTKTYVELSLELTTDMDRSGTRNTAFVGCQENDGKSCFYMNFGGEASQDDSINCWLDKSYSAGGAIKKLLIDRGTRRNRNDIYIDADRASVVWGTNTTAATEKTTVHTQNAMALFGNNSLGTLLPFNLAHMRVYSCRIYDADGLVRDFVPSRELTGQKRAGLYDRVNKKFHPNAAGTDDFLTAADETVLYPLTVTSLARDRRGPVDPDYGTHFVPAGADVPFAALADVDPDNPKVRFRGWKMSAQDDEGAWQTLDEGQGKSVLFSQPASPAKFTWNWGGQGLIIVVE